MSRLLNCDPKYLDKVYKIRRNVFFPEPVKDSDGKLDCKELRFELSEDRRPVGNLLFVGIIGISFL